VHQVGDQPRLNCGSKYFYNSTDSFNIYNLTFLIPWLCDESFDYSTCLHVPCTYSHRSIIIVIIIIFFGSTAMRGAWPPQANVASELFSGQQPPSFYNQFSLHLPLPCPSILISIEAYIAQYL